MKRSRHIAFLLTVVLLWSGVQQSAADSNLLSNGSFESYDCGAMGCSFSDWALPLNSGSINTTDKIEGEVSLQMYPTAISATLDNSVYLPDSYYAAGDTFFITMYYKVLHLPEYEAISLDCYWEPEPGGDAEGMKKHDADKLQRVLSDTLSADWEKIVICTTKPEFSTRLRIRVVVPKKAKALLDAFSVEEAQTAEDEPFIRITPLKLSAVTTTIGNTVDFAMVHVQQGNLTGPTTFELSGYNADQFRLSATSLAADQCEIDLIITYAPTEAGTHTALLNIDNLKHTSLFQSIKLTGICTDPTLQPSISVTPDTLSDFSAVEGQEMRDTFTVTSANCQDYVYLRVTHILGAAFTIDESMMGRNATSNVEVRFAPKEEGDYISTVTIYSEGVESVVVTLRGTGIKRSEETIDWQTHFEWDESNPMKLMNETFDNVGHNKTIVLDGWQNVALVDERPWWGFDEERTSPKRGTERYAKATAYQYGKSKTGIWETFLVTPPLDYRNSAGKIFAFSVMGEYLPDAEDLGSMSEPTMLEIYYVDAMGEKAYFQDLTESFVFPSTSEEDYIWRTYFLNLEPYAETMADVFHIAFRYIGPNGGDGAVTYYIDNVSWGRTDLPEIRVMPTYIIDSAAVVGEEHLLGEIEVEGKNLTSAITVGVTGANYNRFYLSAGTLPKEGGKFTLSFLGQEEGVHEAYVFLSSKGAADAFIPLSVLCRKTQGVESVPDIEVRTQKVLRQGQIIIIRGDSEYSLLGTKIR